MKSLILLFAIFLSLKSQNSDFIQLEKSVTYRNHLSQNKSWDIIDLADSWEIRKNETESWSSISIPFLIDKHVNSKAFSLRKSFHIGTSADTDTYELHLYGCYGKAVISINGDYLFSYVFYGAPVKINLNKYLLKDNAENLIEIEFDGHLDYENSIPRASIYDEAEKFYGCSGDIFIRKSRKNYFNTVSFSFTNHHLEINFNPDYLDSLKKINLIEVRIFDTDQNELAIQSFKLPRNQALDSTVVTILNSFPKIFNDRLDLTAVIISIQLLDVHSSVLAKHKDFYMPQLSNSKLIMASYVANENDLTDNMEHHERLILQFKKAGFNSILYQNIYPNPILNILASKYRLSIYYLLPFYSHTLKQFNENESTAFLTNYKKTVDDLFIPVLHHLEMKNLAEVAKRFQLNYIQDSKLFIQDKATNLILLEPGVFKDLSGYNNRNNEESQAKALKDIFKSQSLESFLIFYLNDHKTDLPLLENMHQNDSYTSHKGLLSKDYEEKKSFTYIESKVLDQKEPIFIPGDKKKNDQYSFIIFGIIILAILAISYHQSPRLNDNFKRALFHTYGFFSDTRERRIIYVGQTLYIMFLVVAIISNIAASYIFFYKDNPLFSIIINYTFNPKIADFLIHQILNAESLILLNIILCLSLILFMVFYVKFIQIFARKKIMYKQSFVVVVWSLIPFFFLLPISLFAYTALANNQFTFIINSVIILVFTWVVLRLLNGIRVVHQITYMKTYTVSLLLLVMMTVCSYYLLEYLLNFESYISYFKYING